MTKTVAVYSMKGGVGKTTLAANLAYCSAVKSHLQTLIWDIDAQGAASFLFGLEQAPTKVKRIFSRDIEPAALVVPTQWPQLDLLGADLSLRRLDQMLSDTEKPKWLRKLLQTLPAKYARIILDCPPGLGEISDQLFRAADLIVVPVPPSPLALRSFEQVKDHIERNHERRPLLLPVITMVDRRKTLHREFVAEHSGWPVIPHASIVERMAVMRSPVTAYAPRSPAAAAFGNLWDIVEGHLAPQPKEPAPAPGRKLARIPKGRS
jgi:chromosome partitioning protein